MLMLAKWSTKTFQPNKILGVKFGLGSSSSSGWEPGLGLDLVCEVVMSSCL